MHPQAQPEPLSALRRPTRSIPSNNVATSFLRKQPIAQPSVVLRESRFSSFRRKPESRMSHYWNVSFTSAALDSRLQRLLNNSGIVPKGSVPSVILNGAKRSEESEASLCKAKMHLMSGLGFFAALRMTLVWVLFTSYARVSLHGNDTGGTSLRRNQRLVHGCFVQPGGRVAR